MDRSSEEDRSTVELSSSGSSEAPPGDSDPRAGEDLENRRIFAAVREGLLGEPTEPLEVGRYRVLEKVGAGGLGVVYAAFDPELERRIAVKLLRPDRKLGSEASQVHGRIWREAQAMAKLSHPNVVDVYDVGTFEDRTFIAMEFIEGGSLREWLEAEPRPWPQILDVFLRAGRGLAAAHHAGLVHRDFKPDNVMIGADGRVRVMDFGLARPVDELDHVSSQHSMPSVSSTGSGPQALATPLTETGTVMGTPAYMAPEQHLGEHADARSDQFSFCVALFEALFATRPFAGREIKTLAKNKVRGEMVSVPDTKIPRSVRTTIVRGLSSKSEERWQDMDALLAALARASSRSRRWMVGIAAVGAASLFVAAAVTTENEACDDGASKLAAVWDQGRAGAAEEAFAATEVPFAADAWSRVSAQLDAYADAWLVAQVEACRTESERMLDLRMRCLRGRLSELDGLASVLVEADEIVVQHAVAAASRLGSLARCADPDYLTAEVEPPDPAVQDEVDRLRAQLDRAMALDRAGKPHEGLEVAEGVVLDAVALDYAPLGVEAAVRVGFLRDGAGDYEGAKSALSEAYYTGAGIGYDWEAAKAATALVYIVGNRQAQAEEAQMWSRHTNAMLRRLGGNTGLEAQVAAGLGAAAKHDGRYEDALAHYQEALTLYGKTDLMFGTASAANNVGVALVNLGRDDEAAEYYRRALAIRERVLGPDNPSLAGAYNNLGGVLHRQGKRDEAIAMYEHALDIVERALGPDHSDVVHPLNNLGILHMREGRNDEAIQVLTRALAVASRTLGTGHPHTVMTVVNMGQAYTGAGRNTEAIELNLRASSMAERGLGPDNPLVAGPLHNVGSIHHEAGRYAEAYPYFERSVRIWLRRLDPGHPHFSMGLTDLGLSLLRLERFEESVAHLERSLAALESGPGNPKELARTRFALARALWGSGSRRRSVALARQARATYAGLGDEGLEQVEAWLAAK